jgi:hypothetical protein
MLITSESPICGRCCAFWFWGSSNNHLHNAKLEAELLVLLVGCRSRWPGDCSWSQLTALLLGRLPGVCLLFTAARSMGHAVQWSPMKPESWSGWFPLKSSPTCSYRWLHCNFQDMLREYPNALIELNFLTDLHRLANSTPYIVSGWCRNSPWRVPGYWLWGTCSCVVSRRGRVSSATSHVRGMCVTCLPAVA